MVHGQGVLHFNNGSVYKGAFVMGKFEGLGRLKWNDGTPYSGAFLDRDSSFHDWDNGRYYGEFKNGEFHGSGRLTWCDGTYLDSSFKNGVAHGLGHLQMGDDWNFGTGCSPASFANGLIWPLVDTRLKINTRHYVCRLRKHQKCSLKYASGMFHDNWKTGFVKDIIVDKTAQGKRFLGYRVALVTKSEMRDLKLDSRADFWRGISTDLDQFPSIVIRRDSDEYIRCYVSKEEWGEEYMEVERSSSFLSGPTKELRLKHLEWYYCETGTKADWLYYSDSGVKSETTVRYYYSGFLLDNGEPRGKGSMHSHGRGPMGRIENQTLRGDFLPGNTVQGVATVIPMFSREQYRRSGAHGTRSRHFNEISEISEIIHPNPPSVEQIYEGVFKATVGLRGRRGMGGITGRFYIATSTMKIPDHCTYICPFDFDWNPNGFGTIQYEPNEDAYSFYKGYIFTPPRGDQDWHQDWHGKGTLTLSDGTTYHGRFLPKSTEDNSLIYAKDDASIQKMLPVKYEKLRFIAMFAKEHRRTLLYKLSVPFEGECKLPSGETRVGEFRLVCPFMRKLVSGEFGSEAQHDFLSKNYWGYTRHLRDPEYYLIDKTPSGCI